jgi:deoxyribonuclease V|uniref:Endonuclease V n=1 Tax=Thermoanaerobaculum aquaticum TaxID=1312852 RepID=A0A7C2NTG5_9BACT
MSHLRWGAFCEEISAGTMARGEAEAFLRTVAQRVREGPLPFAPSFLVGADVAYGERQAVAAVVVWDLREGKVVWEETREGPVAAEYRPGLFFLREAPLVLPLLSRVPFDGWVALLHGHGTAHPLGAGLASVVGVLLGRPTVGCAGSLLCGRGGEPGQEKGSWSAVWWQGKRVGAFLRTRAGVKPVVVSVGHGLTLEEAVGLVHAASVYRFPEPLRLADALARKVLSAAGGA